MTIPTLPKSPRNKNEHKFVDVFSLYDGTKAGFPLMSKTSPQPGPTIFLTGVIHGEEIIGMEVIHRIFKNITLKRGAIYAIPVGNMAGFSLGSRFVPYGEQTKWDNLNRSFPGNPSGSPAERISAKIYQTIVEVKPDLVIDIHADSHNSIPYIILDRFIEEQKDGSLLSRTRDLAEKYGVLVCNEEPLVDYIAEYNQNSLTGALYNFAKVPSFVIELGGDYFLKESYVRTGVYGIKNILHDFDMLDEAWVPLVSKYKIASDCPLRLLNITGAFLAGKISNRAKLGSYIKKEEVVAVIEDVYGQTKDVVKSPADGYLITLGDRILFFPGMQVASLAVKDESAG